MASLLSVLSRLRPPCSEHSRCGRMIEAILLTVPSGQSSEGILYQYVGNLRRQ